MNQNEETWPQIIRHVWNIGARALRVVPRLNTGSDYVDLAGDSSGNLNVNIGAASISVGGGVQYTEGDSDSSLTGTVALWEDAADTVRAISMAKPLPVQPGTSVAFPVTDNGGSLTVDATNLDIRDLSSASDSVTAVCNGTVSAICSGTITFANGTIAAVVNGTVGAIPPALIEAIYVHGSLAAANINGSASTFAALATHSSALRSMTVYNTTDQTLQVSFDGTITHALLPEGSTESWGWFEDGLKESSNVYVRSNNSAAPTTGRAIANGMTV